jgi:hypothetical protein
MLYKNLIIKNFFMNKCAALLLVLCFFFKVNTVSAQEDIQLIGFPYPDQLKHYVEQCLSFLEVDRNIRINIIQSKSLARFYEGQTIKTGVDTSGRDQFTIYLLAGMKGAKQLLVLAHELVHVKQYVSRSLDIRGDKIYWLGRKYYLRENSLFDPPWENEAYSTDYRLVRNFSTRSKKAKKLTSKFIAKISTSRIRL